MPDPLVRVLLVEDDEVDAEATQRTLSQGTRDFEVTVVSRLAAALDVLSRESTSIDVVVLDLGLPDGAGLESVKAIRQIDCKIPIVILTGWDQAFDRKIKSAGAQQFLSKQDIGNDGLEKAIERALKNAMSKGAMDEHEGEARQTVDESFASPIEPRNPEAELVELATRVRLLCSDLSLSEHKAEDSLIVEELASIAKQIYDRLT